MFASNSLEQINSVSWSSDTTQRPQELLASFWYRLSIVRHCNVLLRSCLLFSHCNGTDKSFDAAAMRQSTCKDGRSHSQYCLNTLVWRKEMNVRKGMQLWNLPAKFAFIPDSIPSLWWWDFVICLRLHDRWRAGRASLIFGGLCWYDQCLSWLKVLENDMLPTEYSAACLKECDQLQSIGSPFSDYQMQTRDYCKLQVD